MNQSQHDADKIEPQVRESSSSDDATSGTNFSLFDPKMNEGCFERYAELRLQCPVSWSGELGGYWVVADYENVAAVMRDTASFSSKVITVPPYDHEFGPMLPQQVDPPDHEMYRHDLNLLLSPQRVARIEDSARQVARELWQGIQARGTGELKADFCTPYTSIVVARFLGYPEEEIEQLRRWTEMGAELNFPPPTESEPGAEEGYAPARDLDALEAYNSEVKPQIYAYLERTLQGREETSCPPDDVITGLTHATVGERRYTRDEQIRTLNLLTLAGLDTTQNLLSMVLWHLAANPLQFNELKASPERIPAAVDEFVRYFAPAVLARLVTRDTNLGGVDLHAGDLVEVLLPSACRDEQQFEDSESVRFDRLINQHIAFSVGPHRCLGQHLARMEIRVALEEIIRSGCELSLVSPSNVRWESGPVRHVWNIEALVGPAIAHSGSAVS